LAHPGVIQADKEILVDVMAPADAQELKTTEVTVYTKVSALLRRTPSTHEYSKP